MTIDPLRYPRLSSGTREATWSSTPMRFVFELEPPTPELISNVRCAGFSADRVLLIYTEEYGITAFPGGTRECGEDWMQTLRRELREEAGARLLDFEVVGRLHFWSGAERPYRAHLPHPEFHWVVGYGEVEIVGEPFKLAEGEHVRSVELAPLPEAVARIRDHDPWDAELLQLVAEIRSERSGESRSMHVSVRTAGREDVGAIAQLYVEVADEVVAREPSFRHLPRRPASNAVTCPASKRQTAPSWSPSPTTLWLASWTPRSSEPWRKLPSTRPAPTSTSRSSS